MVGARDQVDEAQSGPHRPGGPPRARRTCRRVRAHRGTVAVDADGQSASPTGRPVDVDGRTATVLVALVGEPARGSGRDHEPRGDPLQAVRPSHVGAADATEQRVSGPVVGRADRHRTRRKGCGGEHPAAVEVGERHDRRAVVLRTEPDLVGVRRGERRSPAVEQAGQPSHGSGVRHDVSRHAVERLDDRPVRADDEEDRPGALQGSEVGGRDPAGGELDLGDAGVAEREQLPPVGHPEDRRSEVGHDDPGGRRR